MRKILLAFIFVSTSYMTLHAQALSYFNMYQGTSTNVGASTDFAYGSNAITNSFVKSYYNSEFLDDPLKNRVSRQLSKKTSNNAGLDFQNSVWFAHNVDSLFGKKGGYWVSASDVLHFDSRFDKDVFDLFFKGNKMFAGDTANLSDFRLRYVHYRQLQAGLMQEYSCGKGIVRAGIGAAFIQGIKSLEAETGNGTGLYTSLDGEQLYAGVQLKTHQTDTMHTGTFDFTGKGASTDFFISYTEPEKMSVSFEVIGLGKIKWNSSSLHARVDTSLFFTGIQVKNIFKIDSTDYAGYDSTYFKKFVSFNKGTYETFLPARMHLSYERTLIPHRLKMKSGLEYRLMASYTMRAYSSVTYSVCRCWNISALLSYGGYTTWSGGISTAFEFLKGTHVLIGSDYLSYVFQPNNGCSMGAHAGIRKTF